MSHDPLLPSGEGHTPLDDVDGLRLTYITTRAELNEAEERRDRLFSDSSLCF